MILALTSRYLYLLVTFALTVAALLVCWAAPGSSPYAIGFIFLVMAVHQITSRLSAHRPVAAPDILNALTCLACAPAIPLLYGGQPFGAVALVVQAAVTYGAAVWLQRRQSQTHQAE